MNDFTELETELKKLRPAPASPELVSRIEGALQEEPGATPAGGVLPRRSNFRLNWLALGLGLAAAAAFLLLARVNLDRTPTKTQSIASISPSANTPAATASDTFVPAGLTQVLYHTRDEGLHFANGADQPVRRLRSRKRETLSWQNPGTGASLRVTYPSEEVTLIPVPGQ